MKKVDPNRVTLEAKAILKDCNEKELAFLSDIRSSKNFTAGRELLTKLIQRNMSAVFAYSESDPVKLASFKANARGQVGGITLVMELAIGAEAEKTRRGEK